jgi:putative addiction module component (TIGR02574 family)
LLADRARVLEDALTLPVADRARVAHELLRSLETEGGDSEADVAAAWTDEIGRRIDEVEGGTAKLHDLDTVRARLEAAGRA